MAKYIAHAVEQRLIWGINKCTKTCIADGADMPTKRIYMIITTGAEKRKRKNQRIARTADAMEQWEKMGIVTSVVGEYTN